MLVTSQNLASSFLRIKENSTWNSPKKQELKMHKIHVYPAKFPSFLITKSLEYAKRINIRVDTIGDIFCGCGTTALEAKKNNKNFWGCDINPVATLIAKVKRESYNLNILTKYFDNIILCYESGSLKNSFEIFDNDRISYWFEPLQITELSKLLKVINYVVPRGNIMIFSE